MFKVYIVGRWGRREEVARFKSREEAERFASRIREYMGSGLEGLRVEVVENPGLDLGVAFIVLAILVATTVTAMLPLCREGGRGGGQGR
jgi:hypothetical protein